MSLNKEVIEHEVVRALKLVFDPEIPVNIYDLGLVYEIYVGDDGDVGLLMTLTSPNCPMADFIIEDTRLVVSQIKDVTSVAIQITFDPPWSKDMMSEEAMLELGLL